MNEHDGGSEMELFVRKVQAETRRYIQDLLSENQRLRSLAANLQFEKERLEAEVHAVRETLEKELAEVAAENRRYSEEFVAVEQQNSSLANLYVAMSRLHSTLDREEVLGSILEILEFLVGCEQLALFEKNGDALHLVASKGIDAARWRTVPSGEGAIGRAVTSAETWYAPESGAEPDELTACVPLRLRGEVTGAIALYRLLPQKGGRLQSVDHELLDLLGTQAAHALHCATLASQAPASA